MNHLNLTDCRILNYIVFWRTSPLPRSPPLSSAIILLHLQNHINLSLLSGGIILRRSKQDDLYHYIHYINRIP